MTDTKKLRNIIDGTGIKYKILAKNVGLSPHGLQKKIDNDNQFKAEEIAKISSILKLTARQRDEIFFANKVE